ncbi:MAG: dicarboxylate/amino acid:cation symporter [Gemmatimonadota bacterium]
MLLRYGMLIGLAVGLAFGLVAGMTQSPLLIAIAEGSRPFGTAFVNAIQMVVIPLVMTVVFVGVARLGNLRKVGRAGGIAMAFYWGTTVIAILTGMVLMKLVLLTGPQIPAPTAAEATAPELPGIVDFLLRLIPRNPFEAASSGTLLPLIVFTVLFAAAAGTLEPVRRQKLVDVADAAAQALIQLVHWILMTGIVGVFGLAAPVAATTGWGLLRGLAIFILTVLAGLAIFVVLVYLPLVAFVGRIGPLRFLRGTTGTQVVGFATGSSVAALPVMIQDAEENLSLSPAVTRLVLPLGASLNRSGSALFQGAAVVFVAYLYDVPVPWAALGGALLATFFVAATVAPVPSASVMTLAPALDAVGAPLAGLGVLLGVDRIPDAFRTWVNVTGHIAGAAVAQSLVGDETPGPSSGEG